MQKQNPNRNIFARFDAYLPMNTHFVLRHNYASADNTTFSRGAATSANPNFNLTSNLYLFSSKTNATVAEFLTNWQNGLYNELLLNLTKTSDFRTVPVRYPAAHGSRHSALRRQAGTVNFVIGTEASSQGNSLDQRTFEITDNFTVPVGTHAFTFGVKDQFYKPINLFAQNSLGSWTFNDLASLQNGVASSYSVSAPTPTDPAKGLATFHASMLGLYAQDSWQVTPTSLGDRRRPLRRAELRRHAADQRVGAVGVQPRHAQRAGQRRRLAALRVQLGRHRRPGEPAPRRHRRVHGSAAVRVPLERVRQLGHHGLRVADVQRFDDGRDVARRAGVQRGEHRDAADVVRRGRGQGRRDGREQLVDQHDRSELQVPAVPQGDVGLGSPIHATTSSERSKVSTRARRNNVFYQNLALAGHAGRRTRTAARCTAF